jgi:hypothetical protein
VCVCVCVCVYFPFDNKNGFVVKALPLNIIRIRGDPD